MDERRNHDRVRRQLMITCRNETVNFETVTMDICPGGVFIVTNKLLAPKTMLDIEIHFDSASPVVCRGEVTWVNRGQVVYYPAGFGVRFKDIPLESLEILLPACSETFQDAW
ncbi:MAG: PilZ domain-containing protein [Acidobacteriota bacterium]